MNDLKISGYGDDLTVNGIRIGDLTPKQHEEIELNNSSMSLVFSGFISIKKNT